MGKVGLAKSKGWLVPLKRKGEKIVLHRGYGIVENAGNKSGTHSGMNKGRRKRDKGCVGRRRGGGRGDMRKWWHFQSNKQKRGLLAGKEKESTV